ncbi:hypothetical protein [Bacillus toyonensis]|uniref:hypothetical protein n=1 Tax=Bacillus toyonensis TaxID=155322 RepID=UPI00027BEAAF|nr:hypothetical protein [Bacillus toyonensis]EJV41783.1 hypothetical protein IEA_05668 [Bacillus toyonensis]
MRKSTILFLMSGLFYTIWICGMTEFLDIHIAWLFVLVTLGWVNLVLGLEAEKKGK